jgi:hypothetical protein
VARYTILAILAVALLCLVYVFKSAVAPTPTAAEARAWLAVIQSGRPAAEAEAVFRAKRVPFERLSASVITASISLHDPNAAWYVNSFLRVRVTVDEQDRIASVEAYRFNYGP